MEYVNQETKKKLEKITKNVQEYAILVDNQDKKASVEGLDVTPGLGLHTEAENFRSISKDIQDGIFKTIVMGRFKNGKSTFINALTGEALMAARATACTAVIATVEFGNDGEHVRVFYTDSDKPKIISHDRFLNEFSISQAEQDAMYDNEGGRLERFANVSHAEMQSTDSLFEDGLRLIDSPGLEEDISRTRMTNEYVPKANAIIFMLSALALFSAKEKEYIKENFEGKHLKNVFFVINRINQVNEPLEENVMPTVRNSLSKVFTDASGKFDEKLYEKRVFYVDAYGALCARTGEPYKILAGRKEMVAPIAIEETGFPEFEAALKDFLNSDERIHATFSSTLSGMANAYQSAAEQVEANKAVRSQSQAEREKNAALAQKELDEAQKKVDEIRNTVNTSGTIIAQKVYNDLIRFVQNDIPREFDAYCENSGLAKSLKEDFGMMDMVKLATSMVMQKMPLQAIKEKAPDQAKILEPLVNRVNSYIKDQLLKWSKQIPTLISQDVKALSDELKVQTAEFDLRMDAAVNRFAYGNAKAPVSKEGGGIKEGLQSLVALSNWDVSLALETNAEGGMDWGKFAKRIGEQLILDLIVTGIFGAPYIIICLLVEVFSASHHAGKMAQDMHKSIGGTAFEALTAKVRESEVDFKENIIAEFAGKGENIAEAAIGKVQDARNNMYALLKENAADQTDASLKNQREDKNLAAMHERIDSVYESLYGRKPTDQEFKNLARNVVKK